MFGKLFPKSCKKLKIFISYARPDKELAAEVAQALRNRGDKVFFDSDSLVPADDFNIQIEKSVAQSNRFVFLASAASLSGGRYTLTELNAAKAKWPSPVGRFVTVLADEATTPDQLDPYLRSVQVLKPSGDTVAEVASLIDRNRPVGTLCRLVATAFLALLGTGLGFLGKSWWDARESQQAAISHGPVAFVGHWLGAPSVTASLTFDNPRPELQIIGITNAELTGPDRQTYQMPRGFTLVPPGPDQALLTPVTLRHDETFAANYEFLGAPRATSGVMAELARRAPIPFPLIPDDRVDLVPEPFLSRTKDAAREDFVWVPGPWTFSLTYTSGENLNDSKAHVMAFSFTLTEADITTMLGWMDTYESGAGVALQWRHMDTFGAPHILQKTVTSVAAAE